MSPVPDQVTRSLRRTARAERGPVLEGKVLRGRSQAPPAVVSRRLRSSTWRAVNSWWLAIPVVGLPWLSFLYMGVRAGRAQWILAALLYLLAGAAALGLVLDGTSWSVAAGLVLGAGTWGTGVVHSVMSNSLWLRFKAAFAPPALDDPDRAPAVEPAAAPADPTSDLQQQQRATIRTVNRAGGRLPDGAVPLVRQIDDVLTPLLRDLDSREPDVAQLHTLRAIVTEYLPGAVQGYLQLPEDYAETAQGPDGATPAQELLNQLQLLLEGARELQHAVYAHDAQRLATQGRFLDAKFRRSDLDL